MKRKSFLYYKTGWDKAPINTLSDLKSNISSHGRIKINSNLLIIALTMICLQAIKLKQTRRKAKEINK